MKTTDRLPLSGARSRRYASHRLHPHGPPTRCPNRILPFRARSIQTGTNPSRTGRNVAALKGAPNVILILLDDVGFGATATFGGPVATPFLSRLAARAALQPFPRQRDVLTHARRAALRTQKPRSRLRRDYGIRGRLSGLQLGLAHKRCVRRGGLKVGLVGEICGSSIRSNGHRKLGSCSPRTRCGITRLQLFLFVACCLSN
jgi:hypothetical protein